MDRRTGAERETDRVGLHPLLDQLPDHGDEAGVRADGGGAHVGHPQFRRVLGGFLIEIEEHFEAIGDEADRADHDIVFPLGVQRIVDETMASATRMHLAEKGKDPRRYTMIAFGGAGPVHAWNLARLLKIKRLVVPLGAGVASALGFLVAPPATDMVRSYVARLERIDWARVNALFAEMQAAGSALLTEAGAAPGSIAFRPVAEMRHVGQGFEIPVRLPSLALSDADLPAIRRSFFASYQERFGRTTEELPI